MMQPPLLTISDSHDSYPGRVSVFKFRHLGSSRFNEMAFLVHDGDGSFTHHGQVFFLRTTKGGFQVIGRQGTFTYQNLQRPCLYFNDWACDPAPCVVRHNLTWTLVQNPHPSYQVAWLVYITFCLIHVYHVFCVILFNHYNHCVSYH